MQSIGLMIGYEEAESCQVTRDEKYDRFVASG